MSNEIDENLKIIMQAIKERKQIKFEYDNPKKPEEVGDRIGNPHCVFMSANGDGVMKVAIVQTDGVGSIILFPKAMIFDNIKNVELLDEEFEVADCYKSDAPSYVNKVLDVNEDDEE